MITETPFYERLLRGFKPASIAQRAALECPAELLLFGGAAGSLKSQTLLIDALKYVHRPSYRGLIIRKSYPEIRFLIDRTRTLYSQTGGTFHEADKTWKWPWGAAIDFRYMERDADVHKFQGWEYQFIGFDESTHNNEFQIRYLLNSRMRSTEGIPIRMRLATNPGNVSHQMHKYVFHGPKCIHCILKEAELAGTEPKWLPDSRRPFTLYRDAKWHSDKTLIGYSTMFIPGKVTEHALFGAGGGQYAKQLRGLPKALQEALLEGCWEAFEGQFFDCFDINTHLIPRAAVKEKPWWPHWIGLDYGFGHGCVAYLFTMDPDRNVYTLAEYGPVHRRTVTDVAKDVEKIWGHHDIHGRFISHDLFRHDGTEDLSRAELMSQATGKFYEPGYKERVSGAMLMYTLLAEHRWLICQETCPLLPIALQTRVHDEKDPEDVLKVDCDEDDAYDACRYGIATYINPTDKPLEEKLRDLQKDEWSTDPTVAMIQYRMWESKQRQEASPITFNTGRGRSR